MMHLTRYVNHHRELNNIYISHIYFFPSRKFNEIVPVVYIDIDQTYKYGVHQKSKLDLDSL